MEEAKRPAAASRANYERALEGMAFPASVPMIVRTAHDRGGLDTEVLDILGRLPPDRDYDSVDDVWQAVREIYAAEGIESPV